MSFFIVIPTYNSSKTIGKCLNAILKQELLTEIKKVEIVLVDDCSKDDTTTKIEKIIKNTTNQDPNNNKFMIKLIKLPKNNGPAHARNVGIQNSTGEIIGFTDSDCFPLPNWINEAYKHFKDKEIIGVEGRLIPESDIVFPTISAPNNESGNQFLTANIFYHRTTIEEVGGFDERFKLAHREDSDLAWSISEKVKGKIIFDPSCKVMHSFNKTSMIKLIKNTYKKTTYDPLLFKKHPARFSKDFKAIKRFLLQGTPDWIFIITLLALIYIGFPTWKTLIKPYNWETLSLNETITALLLITILLSNYLLVIFLDLALMDNRYLSGFLTLPKKEKLSVILLWWLFILARRLGLLIGSIKHKKLLL